jgi:hypothetical protein
MTSETTRIVAHQYPSAARSNDGRPSAPSETSLPSKTPSSGIRSTPGVARSSASSRES